MFSRSQTKIHLSIRKVFIAIILFVTPAISVGANQSSFNILITNDDGIGTKEIEVLASALKKIANVYVVAPHGNKSGTGGVVSPDWAELEKGSVFKDGILFGYGIINGFPADTVHIATKLLYKEIKFNLVVSGINQGMNHGEYRYYSGTVGAANEAVILGIPAIAISQSRRGGLETTLVAASFAKVIVNQIRINGLPNGTLLNINVPNGTIKGVVFSPRNNEFKSEIAALKTGYITISPLNSDLSDYPSLDHFKDWDLGYRIQ